MHSETGVDGGQEVGRAGSQMLGRKHSGVKTQKNMPVPKVRAPIPVGDCFPAEGLPLPCEPS